MYHLLWLSTLGGVSARLVEPYGWACYTLAGKMDWPECDGKTGDDLRACLCDLPMFVSVTTECLARAVVNDSNPYDAFDRGYLSLCQREPEIDLLVDTVSDGLLQDGVDTAKADIRNKELSQIYGLVLMLFWLSICLVRLVAVALSSFAPKWTQRIRDNKVAMTLKSNILYPATGRENHAVPVLRIGKLSIRMPLRWISIVTSAFIILNIVFLFSSFSIVERSITFKTRSMQIKRALGYRSACLTMFMLPILLLFGGRNNFLMPWTRWNHGVFVIFHKWIARMIFVNIVIHATCYSLLRTEQGLYPGVFKKFYWKWGAGGIGSLSLLVFFSLPYFRQHKYEFFLVAHILLAVSFIVACWYHIRTLDYGKYHVIAAIVVWGADRLLRFLRTALLSPRHATITHSKHLSCLIIDNPGHWSADPGSHIYVHFSKLRFWESHPFSIVPTPEGNIKLCIQRKQGLTGLLDSLTDEKLKVWIDGPYGYHRSYKNYNHMVFIAGGVGITQSLGMIYGLLERKVPPKISLYWSIPFSDYLEFFTTDIQRLQADIDLEIFITRECPGENDEQKNDPVRYGHMDIKQIVTSIGETSPSVAIMVCGPPRMNDNVRKESCNALKKGASITYTEELFCN